MSGSTDVSRNRSPAASKLRWWERHRASPLTPHSGQVRRRGTGRLVVASNRLPVSLERTDGGAWRAQPAAGGLVTALDPVMRRRGGLWLGWPGVAGAGDQALSEALARTAGDPPCPLQAVDLDAREQEAFYLGFCNQVLWPAFHGFPARIRSEASWWEAYRAVNRRFARTLHGLARWDDLVWVHDYHLMLVARELRQMGTADHRLSFFLHIPFPGPRVLARVPRHRELLQGLLEFDLLGFQREEDRRHFLSCVEAFVPEALAPDGGGAEPKLGGRRTVTRSFPISIDFDEFARGAESPEVLAESREIRQEVGDHTSLVLGVDRLDYSKGIPAKLRGLARVLERRPSLRGRLTLVQLVVPSRDVIPAYRETHREIETLVKEINGRWADDGWTPVRYDYGRWSRERLLAHYRSADMALVTPLNDGMNLVAKEYCAANAGDGVLVLSVHAGAADELGKAAVMVDPASPDSIAQGILDALCMPERERRLAMREAREHLRTHDVHGWVGSFMAESIRAG